MRLFSLLILMLISFGFQSSLAKAEIADRLVAVVNNDIITLSELNEEGEPYFQALIKQAPTAQLQHEMQKLKQDILSHLIDQRLIEQQAAKYDIKISDEDINQAIETMLSENRGTMDDLKKDLATKGLSEEQYRKQLKSQMLQARLINYEVRSKVVVTDDKINQYYKDNYTSLPGSASGYHLLQMGFLWGDQYKRTQDEARNAAESAKKQLDEGASFGDVARSVSDLPSKEDGGDIGIFQENELAPYMKEAILTMKSGDISGIIETPTEYQILKVLSDQGSAQGSAPPLMEVKKDIETQLYKQEGEQLFKKWITELRANAFIKQNL